MSALRLLRTPATRLLAGRQSLASSSFSRNIVLGCSRITPVLPQRAFSVSSTRLGEGTSDLPLLEKLKEELQYEKDAAAEAEAVPEFIKAFKENGIWKIEDRPGHDEVALTRKFGNEHIRIMFSIAELQSSDPSYEQESETQEAANEGNEDAEEEEDMEEPLQTYPLRASVTITKPGKNGGALNFDMAVQEGTFVTDNISFYKDAKVAEELTAEADWTRRGMYVGPQFETLDLGVQEQFDRFIAERGIDESLALFIPEYAEHKEQNEYVQWLGNVKNFVEA